MTSQLCEQQSVLFSDNKEAMNMNESFTSTTSAATDLWEDGMDPALPMLSSSQLDRSLSHQKSGKSPSSFSSMAAIVGGGLRTGQKLTKPDNKKHLSDFLGKTIDEKSNHQKRKHGKKQDKEHMNDDIRHCTPIRQQRGDLVRSFSSRCLMMGREKSSSCHEPEQSSLRRVPRPRGSSRSGSRHNSTSSLSGSDHGASRTMSLFQSIHGGGKMTSLSGSNHSVSNTTTSITSKKNDGTSRPSLVTSPSSSTTTRSTSTSPPKMDRRAMFRASRDTRALISTRFLECTTSELVDEYDKIITDLEEEEEQDETIHDFVEGEQEEQDERKGERQDSNHEHKNTTIKPNTKTSQLDGFISKPNTSNSTKTVASLPSSLQRNAPSTVCQPQPQPRQMQRTLCTRSPTNTSRFGNHLPIPVEEEDNDKLQSQQWKRANAGGRQERSPLHRSTSLVGEEVFSQYDHIIQDLESE